MSTHIEDELAVPHFEDRLWDELAELHSRASADEGPIPAGRPGGPADHPDGPAPGSGGWRRLVAHHRRLVAAAAAVVAVAAALGGAALVGRDAGPTTSIAPAEQPDPSAPTSTVPAPEGTSTVPVGPDAQFTELPDVAPTTTPSAGAGTRVTPPSTRPDAVVVVEQRNADGHVNRSWTDESTGLNRSLQLDPAGDPELDSAWLSIEEDGPYRGPKVSDPPDTGVTIRQRQVDYCFREYMEWPWYPPAGEGVPSLPTSWRVDDPIIERIERGELVADGTEVVDGRELLRYVDASYEGVTWLDPETYSPVKVHNYVGSDVEYTQTYTYLPRFPENRALIEPPVPAGFSKVDALRGDGERLDAGCG